MVARFRVATKATGIRRQVYVHVYDDREEMQRAHAAAQGVPFDPSETVAGGVAQQQGYRWPRPVAGPVVVMRLCTEHLSTWVIAHEAVHCATSFFFMDCARWDTRLRSVFTGTGADEPLAYTVGDIASEVIGRLYPLGLLS